MTDALAILNARAGDAVPWWSCKLADNLFTLHNPRADKPILDRAKMHASAPFSTDILDRQGDLLETSGIRTAYHKHNPIALLDHGKRGWSMPLGRTQDRDSWEYLVRIDPKAGVALQTTSFNPHCPVAAQVYRFIDDGDLRGNSIGYRPLRAEIIGEAPGPNQRPPMRLLEVELLEVTWTALGVNPECVRAAMHKRIEGKSLLPEVRAAFEPYAAPAPIWSNGATLPRTEGKAIGEPAFTGTARGVPDPNLINLQPPPAEAGRTDMEGQQVKKPVEPHTAKLLRALYKCVGGMKAIHAGEAPMMEPMHEGIKGGLEGVMKLVHGLEEALVKMFSDHHGDLDPLGDVKGADDSEAPDAPLAGDGMEGMAAKSTDYGPMYTASLTGKQEGKALETVVPEPKAASNDGLTDEERIAVHEFLKNEIAPCVAAVRGNASEIAKGRADMKSEHGELKKLLHDKAGIGTPDGAAKAAAATVAA